MSSIKTIHIFACCTILFWLSFLIYLPPFVASPNINGLTEEGYEMSRLNNPEVSKQDLENKFNKSLYFAYAKSFFFILIGVISGVLIYIQKRIGRYLAIILCLVMLSGRAYSFLKAYLHIFDRLYALYVLALPSHPMQIIHNDIIAPIFFLISIVFLFKRTISEKF
jgi:hypothetical protein